MAGQLICNTGVGPAGLIAMNGQNGVAPLCAVAPNGSNRHSIGVEAGYAPFVEVNINAAPIRALLGGAFVTPSSFISMGAFRGGPATFSVSGPSSISEGSAGIFTVNTTEVPNGTQLWWTINLAGSTTAADFAAAQGTVTINNNQGQFQISVVSDTTDYPNESFTVSIRRNSPTDPIRATSPVVIISDTSPTNPTFYTFAQSAANVSINPTTGSGAYSGQTRTGGPYISGRANTVNFVVNTAVYLWGNIAGSGVGLTITGFSSQDTIVINVSGGSYIMGRGGNGGLQGVGGNGLDAVQVVGTVASVQLQGTGFILGGGGGGGGNGGGVPRGNGGGGAGGGIGGGLTGGGQGTGSGTPGNRGNPGTVNGACRGAGGGSRQIGCSATAFGALRPGNSAAGSTGMGGISGGGGGGSCWGFTGNGNCRAAGGNGGSFNAPGQNGGAAYAAPALSGLVGGGGGGYGAAGGRGATANCGSWINGGTSRAGGAGGNAIRTSAAVNVSAFFGQRFGATGA